VPPDEATIRRVLEAADADRLDAAVGSWLDARLHAAGQAAGHGRRRRRAVAVDGKAVRGTRHASADGQPVHLLAALDQRCGVVLGQVRVDGKTNEITRFAPLLESLDLAGCVITADALHTQREHAEFLVTGKGAHYIQVVEHASHCSCCLSWRVEESSLAASDLDTQAFAASPGEVDGVELAALDLVQHGLAGDAEARGGLAEGQPAVGCLGPDPVAELLVDADLPGCSGGELLAGDEAVA
jgi:predicted transposase YbfD/YdcC